ncbi:hypothetical protein EVAR_40830_1 [Eumeta japonica]|uniref:Uncharacterized protein n=1 Tax=Eumeta variegata TaxID=151549 RepID=A0A4C1WFZ1_EUMVA|nr:hypothetical protein EVAR_40830_1 [Eumeta japonica]
MKSDAENEKGTGVGTKCEPGLQARARPASKSGAVPELKSETKLELTARSFNIKHEEMYTRSAIADGPLLRVDSVKPNSLNCFISPEVFVGREEGAVTQTIKSFGRPYCAICQFVICQIRLTACDTRRRWTPTRRRRNRVARAAATPGGTSVM